MAISQSTITHSDGSTDVNVHVPFIAPPKPSDACSTAKPIVGQLVATVSTTGGSIIGGQNLYYYLSAIDASSNESIPSDPIEVVIPAGTNTNQVTISGINPFDANASLFNVYRALGAPNGQGGTTSGTSPAQLFANQTPPSACAGLSITDTGSNGSNGGAGDPTKMPIAEDVVRIRAYWQLNGESQWRFGGETLNGQGTAVDFVVPHNIQGQAINIQLRSVDSQLNETPSSLAPIAAYTITAAYPAGLGVGGAPGVNDGLIVGGLHILNTSGQLDKSSPMNAQGSITGTPTDTTSYTSTTSSITWSWTAFTVYFPDGSSLSVSSGSQSFSGLSASSTYFFSMYIVKSAGTLTVILSDNSSGLAPSSLQQQAQTVAGDGHVPLWIDRQAATPSSGSGGGSGTSGTCFSGDTKIKTDSGFVRMDELPSEFTVENQTGKHRAKLIVHERSHAPMRIMPDGCLVTDEHLFQRDDGSWSPASEIFSEIAEAKERTVYDVHVITENQEDMHYILKNGYVAHNKKRLCFSGDAAIRTVDGWARMDSLPEEFVIVNRKGNFSARLVKHENCKEVLREMPDGTLVTGEHLVRAAGDHPWFMAVAQFPVSKKKAATLYNVVVDGSDYFSLSNGYEANHMAGLGA